jgi:hypothetical protein
VVPPVLEAFVGRPRVTVGLVGLAMDPRLETGTEEVDEDAAAGGRRAVAGGGMLTLFSSVSSCSSMMADQRVELVGIPATDEAAAAAAVGLVEACLCFLAGVDGALDVDCCTIAAAAEVD